VSFSAPTDPVLTGHQVLRDVLLAEPAVCGRRLSGLGFHIFDRPMESVGGKP
jgi:hypothetical protein